jgi:hypothetical protein
MRRVISIAMAIALFLSVTAGTSGAAPWIEKAGGGMVATDAEHSGLEVELSVASSPTPEAYTAAHGKGHYSFEGNSFRLRATFTCIDATQGTVTAWGPAMVTAGSFDVWGGVTLERTDKGYAVLSLLDNGDGTVSARAGIAVDFFDGGVLPTMIAQNCEYPHSSAVFPATGPGELSFTSK